MWILLLDGRLSKSFPRETDSLHLAAAKRPQGFPPHGLCKTKKAMGGI
jgi:hypothetical protein